MVFAAGAFAHGAGGAAGLDEVGEVAEEVGAGGADARVLPVVGFILFLHKICNGYNHRRL